MNPLVSIITPSYNQAAFLEQTLRSILAQDYAPIEILVADGASTDGSVEIIERIAQRYAHRYAGRAAPLSTPQLAWWVSEPDSGQAEAINKGFSRARGEIIAWLNSDDIYLPGAVSAAVAALQANPQAGLVYGEAITIDPQGRPLNRLAFDDWGLLELMSFRIICQPAVFMRRSILEQAGYLDPTYHFLLDHHLWVRMARLAPLHYARGCLWAAARHHPAAKNVAQAAGFGKEIYRLLDWMQTQPDLARLYEQNRRQVQGGAARLNARYLLDGSQPGPALRAYARALVLRPRFALQHAHRMLYALLAILRLAPWLDRQRAASQASGRTAQHQEQLAASLRQQFGLAASPIDTASTPWPGLSLGSEDAGPSSKDPSLHH